MTRVRFVLLTAAALTIVAGPVGAHTTKTDCPRDAACVWDHPTFQGAMVEVPPTGCVDTRIRSAVNTSDRTLGFFMFAGRYAPAPGTLKPGRQIAQISAGSATGVCAWAPADPCSYDL